MVTPTHRLWGRTKIDALEIGANDWYMDGTQITVTAAQLNGGYAGVNTINIYNATGGALTVGMLLHVSGYDTVSGYLKVEKADCDDEKPAQLIATTTVADTKTTTAVTYYSGAALDTSLLTIGDPIYLSATAGAYTGTIPSGADDTIQIVGRVKTKDASGTVILDLRFGEQSKFGTDNYINASVTAAKLATDVQTTLATAMAGKGITATTGVLTTTVNTLDGAVVSVANDSLVIMDASDGLDKQESVADFVSAIASGTGVTATAGAISVKGYGSVPVGSFRFAAQADCTSVQVGAVSYTVAGAADYPNGIWTIGAGTAVQSAAELIAAINGDTRNAGGPYYVAWADSDADTVFVAALTATTDVALGRTGGAQPATTLGQAGGLAPATKKLQMIAHTVTADDVDTTVDFEFPVPFVPTMFIAQVRASTGAIKLVTDIFTILATPNRINVTTSGATHCAATDIVTVWISE